MISAHVTFFETSPYCPPNTENQKAISFLPILTIPTPNPPPTLKVYSQWPQSLAELSNPVGICNSYIGAKSNIGDSLPTQTISSDSVKD